MMQPFVVLSVVAAGLLALVVVRRAGRKTTTSATASAEKRSHVPQPQSLQKTRAVGLRIGRPDPLDLVRALTEPPGGGIPSGCAGQEAELPMAGAREAVAHAALKLRARQGLLAALTRDTQDVTELALLVQAEPGLSQQILARINRAEYGLGAPVDQLSRAALLVGHIEVRLQAWRACIEAAVEPSSEMTVGAFERHWQHSFTVARTAYALATALGVRRPDLLATAGLLHDAGKLLALSVWPDRARAFDQVRFSDRQALQLEISRLGLCHAHLGAVLWRELRLPEEVCAIVAHHHTPSYVSPAAVDGPAKSVATVHVADLLAHLAQAHLAGRPAPSVYRPVEGWLDVLKARSLEELLAPHVVLALLDPATAWNGASLAVSAA